MLKQKKEVREIFESWVEEQDAEGLVVHSDLARIFKVKPKHNIDVVIVGYTEGDNKGKIRDILFALCKEDNQYQIIGKTGNGFTEDEKESIFKELSGMQVESRYLETDSRNIAYRMVRPEIVIEISCSDLNTESLKGIKENPLLSYEVKKGYNLQRIIPGVSLIPLCICATT